MRIGLRRTSAQAKELPGGKRAEVLDFMDFLRTQLVLKREKEGEEYSHYLETLGNKIRDRGGLKLEKTMENRIRKLTPFLFLASPTSNRTR